VKNGEISFSDYINCLTTEKPKNVNQKRFKSRKHDVFTEATNKIGLSCEDDKRIIPKDKVNTLARGNRRLKTLKEEDLIISKSRTSVATVVAK
jgi:hypothetical protein